jgi:hypothetical protein
MNGNPTSVKRQILRYLSIRRVFVVVLFLGLFIMAARSVRDPDLWWHLRTGQYILETHHIPHGDVFSFTRAGEPWITHEWLTELLLFMVFRAAGFGGLIFIFGVIIAAAFVITYFRSAGRPYLAGSFVLLGVLATISNWGVRPQMISMLLVAIVLLLLERAERSGQTRDLWWLVPLMLLWVNVHAGYAVGFALMLLTFLGWLAECCFLPLRRQQLAPKLRSLGAVIVACAVVVPLNPDGLKLFQYPLETLRSRTMQLYIVEWASPNFHEGNMKPLLVLMLFAFMTLTVWPKALRMAPVFLLLGTTFAALISVRHVPLFVLVAVPMICECLYGQPRTGKFLAALSGQESYPGLRKAAFNAILIAAMACFVGIRFRYVIQQQPAMEAKYFPASAVKFIESSHPPAPIFNYYDWGGYFIWNLYPRYRVFIDGRADVYGDKQMDLFTATIQGQHGWEETLRQFDIQTVIVPPKSKLAELLRLSAKWKGTFEDEQTAIFIRSSTLAMSTAEAANPKSIMSLQ